MHGTNLEDLATRLKPRTASNFLLWGVTGFVVVFFLWAALTELDRTVRGMGRVIPSGQLQIISNLEGGVVQDILVRTGQFVRAGQELIRIDPTPATSDFATGEATFSALQVKIARLEAELSGREPVYPAAANGAIAEQIQIERALHAARMADLSGRLNGAQARMTQAQRAVNEADNAYAARISARDARASELATIRPLVERGIEPRMSLVQAESAAAVAASEAAASAASAARARAAVSEAQASIAQIRQDWRAAAGTELATAQAEMAARRQALPALADRLDRTVVRAPLAGRINRVLITTRGGTIRPGEPLVELVPSDQSLLIDARIRPQDIATVHIGQRARVSITAYDRSLYGLLEAQVVTVSPDATVEERTGESFYHVRVRTDRNYLETANGARMPIGPGMVAEVDLLGEKRTILQYILTPITRLSETALRE